MMGRVKTCGVLLKLCSKGGIKGCKQFTWQCAQTVESTVLPLENSLPVVGCSPNSAGHIRSCISDRRLAFKRLPCPFPYIQMSASFWVRSAVISDQWLSPSHRGLKILLREKVPFGLRALRLRFSESVETLRRVKNIARHTQGAQLVSSDFYILNNESRECPSWAW